MQAPRVGDGQGMDSLSCCSSLGRQKLDMSEQLNWTEVLYMYTYMY